MTSFTWFAWGPTLVDLVELLFLYTRQISNSPHEAQNDNLWPCFLAVEALPLPSTNRSTLEFVFYFPKTKGRIFCPYFIGVWSPSSSPLPIMIHSSLFLISLWRLKDSKNFCPCFSSMITLPRGPLRKVASHSGLPQNIQWELKMTGLSTLGKRGRWMKS